MAKYVEMSQERVNIEVKEVNSRCLPDSKCQGIFVNGKMVSRVCNGYRVIGDVTVLKRATDAPQSWPYIVEYDIQNGGDIEERGIGFSEL